IFLYMLPLRARLSLLLDSDPCSIRVSSVAQGSLASLLSGTRVRSVAKEQARASVPHFLAKPKVRPLPTGLQIGNLLPARSLRFWSAMINSRTYLLTLLYPPSQTRFCTNCFIDSGRAIFIVSISNPSSEFILGRLAVSVNLLPRSVNPPGP